MKRVILFLMDLVARIKQFFLEDMWLTDLSRVSFFTRFYVRTSRIGMTAVRSYRQDKCGLHASALTYITLVSLVPMLAIMFSFTKGMGMQRLVLDKIGMEKVELAVPNVEGESFEFKVLMPVVDESGAVVSEPEGFAHKAPEAVQKALIGIFTYVEHTNFAALGLIGSLMLLISVVTSIAKLETCFNIIWGVTVPRSMLRKFSEYLIVLILAPLVFVVVTSMNTLLMSERVIGLFQDYAGTVAGLMFFLIRLISCVLILLTFAFFYMFMPHTKVRLVPALVAGVVAGLLWFGVQWAYIVLQVGLSKFNKIYGTFAVVPFFLAWLYANWSIILLGGELSYAIQNHKLFRTSKLPETMPEGACMLLGQLIMYEACKSFDQGENGWCPSLFGLKNSIPLRQLRYSVETLCRAKLLVEVNGDTYSEARFLPGRSPSLITLAHVEEAFRESRTVEARVYLKLLPESYQKEIETFYGTFAKGLSKVNFSTVAPEVSEV